MDFIINRLSLGRNFENFLEKNSKRKSKFHPKRVPQSGIGPGPPGWQPAIVSTTPTWLVVGNASFPQIKTIREYNSIISVGERANTHYTTLDPKLSTRSLRSLDWWILGLEWYNSCYARSPTNIIPYSRMCKIRKCKIIIEQFRKKGMKRLQMTLASSTILYSVTKKISLSHVNATFSVFAKHFIS